VSAARRGVGRRGIKPDDIPEEGYG
jgi:hypothetical protein